jgi:hypothetical protein
MMCEYTCRDCGIHVIAIVLDTPPTPPRCAICMFAAGIADSSDREAIRAHCLDTEGMMHWKRIGCYIDESFPERACDYCGRRYRGPAVYCRQACALADV